MDPLSQRFFDIYLRELIAEVGKRPDQYTWPVEQAPIVAEKMVAALKRGSGNKNSNAIRRTCKELAIPYTYKGLAAYFGGQ